MKEQSALTQLVDGKLPEMVRWYHPALLARVFIRTVVSSVFGQYADQRLVQAASDPGSVGDIIARYDYSNPKAASDHQRINVATDGSYWIDYLADTGDGFESTYTMAYLTALDSLRVNDVDGKTRLKLNHGGILIMGGDQCYPQASREDYMQKLVTPYQWALDLPDATRKLFAIPGNHDWYDGLAAFDSLFCSARGDRLSPNAGGTRIGGWQCQQHRSYWALKLPHRWWIWGTDIQFSKYLDSSQIAYFVAKASEMQEGDNLVLCIAEPSWLLNDFGQPDEEENFYKITSIARQAGARIRAVVAGDWHHYARYYSPDLDVHFITAGGGGSFLHPTHVLRNEIKVEWPRRDKPTKLPPGTFGPEVPGWHKEQVDIRLSKVDQDQGPMGGVAAKVGEAVEGAVVEPIEQAIKGRKLRPRLKPRAPKCYPERGLSMLISLRNMFFPLMNPGFGIGIGLIYWIITWEFYALVERHDISSGEIDAVGVHTSFWDVYKYTPFYLVQGLLVSIPLAVMLLVLWSSLVAYVDSGAKNRVGLMFTKGVVGTLHFLAHVFAMFALGLSFVWVNNLVAPRIEAYANQIWVASAAPGATGAVAKKVLEPLSEGRAQQREMFGQGDQRPADRRLTANRAAPPAVALPDGAQAPSEQNKLRTKSVRQLVGFIFYPLEMIFIGGLVGGFVWGMYWVLTGIMLRMHSEDAFAALRIKHYKNFLRFKFEPDKLTIYPLGVDKVPGKRFWTSREGATRVPPNNPRLLAPHDIPVRLIERPIVIYADGRDTA